jgi:hypothetical protein
MTGDVTAGIGYQIISVNDMRFIYLGNDGQTWHSPFYVRFSIGWPTSSKPPTTGNEVVYKNLNLRFTMSYR